MADILLVEDNHDLRTVLCRALMKRNYAVETAENGKIALEKMLQKKYPVVVTDLMMPEVDGMGVLAKVRELYPNTKVIMVTAFGTVENAVQAMQQGAFDYILKPFSPDELELKIEKALQLQTMSDEVPTEHLGYGSIIGSSAAMQKVYELIDKVSPTNAPVLITGKSGTGKELVAREIHQRSQRSKGPFVAVNCVALASGVLESELFGHEKGSFTGAAARRMGKFEAANGGTLFLDEIGELNDTIQVKLLRFLQEKDFQRVGGNENIKVDVRVIAATNRHLTERIAQGHFREDLYYRLNMVSIQLPALMEREDDIAELASAFVQKYNREIQKNVRLAPEVIALLKRHPWPGNVRELENVIAQAVILTDHDVIEAKHLPRELSGEMHEVSLSSDERKVSISTKLDAIESEVIRKALVEVNWNQTKAALKLGLKRTSLQYKMQKYGLLKPHRENTHEHTS